MPRSLRHLLLLTVCVAVPLAGPAAASADPARDCAQHGSLTRTYTLAQLRAALGALPADVREYTDCYDQIRRAELAAAATQGKKKKSGSSGSGSAGSGSSGSSGSGSSGAGSSSGSSSSRSSGGSGAAGSSAARGATPDAAQAARKAATGTVRVGDQNVKPGASGLTGGDGSSLPTPLVIALGTLALGALALAVSRIRTRVVGRRLA